MPAPPPSRRRILGDRLAGRLPLKAIRYTAAVVFAVLGVLNLCKMQM
jgi:hypothetical protein